MVVKEEEKEMEMEVRKGGEEEEEKTKKLVRLINDPKCSIFSTSI